MIYAQTGFLDQLIFSKRGKFRHNASLDIIPITLPTKTTENDGKQEKGGGERNRLI
jgi:hypothetical protein